MHRLDLGWVLFLFPIPSFTCPFFFYFYFFYFFYSLVLIWIRLSTDTDRLFSFHTMWYGP